MNKCLVLLFAIMTLSTASFTQSEMQSAHRAEIKISGIVRSHPEPLVNRDLLGWLKSGQVVFAANNLLPEMSSSLEPVNGKNQIVLWYNFDYLLDVPDVASQSDKQALLQLEVYHEATHISDHIKGKYRLFPLKMSRHSAPKDLYERMWNMEWSATGAEWALAKKWGKPYLVPVIYKYTRRGENPRTFLEGFYQLQLAGNAAVFDPQLAAEFRKRYELEKRKLPPAFR